MKSKFSFFEAKNNKYFLGHLLIIVLLISSCSSLPIKSLPSNNYSERVKFLVMHYTAIDYQQSVTALVDQGGVSSHYLIPESNDDSYKESELSIYQLVPESKRAWHAGSSYWQGRIDLNDQSIGIEIVNVPECRKLEKIEGERVLNYQQENDDNKLCVFPDFDPKQVELIIQLSKDILKRNPDITPTQVIGHSDITPTRKNDPGPRFPWQQLYQAGIGAWYETETVDKYWQLFNATAPNIGLVQKALNSYGYGIIETGELDSQTLDTLSAFQMHFIPWKVTGKPDSKTVATIFALLEKYFPEKIERLLSRYEDEKVVESISLFKPKRGQIDQRFPEVERSTRALVNDRATFKSYRGGGEIIIDNNDALSADIYVNGEKLNINTKMEHGQRYQYSLKRRTKNGVNTLRVDNILPEGASLNIIIPFPELTLATNKNSTRFKKVDEQIQSDIEQGFPGAVLMVIKNGKVIKHSAYGFAKKYEDGGHLLASPVPMTTNTIFDIASNTKMFATNFALMKLVSEGRLDTNKPISYYLPDYTGAGRDTRLVKDLLTHSAGYAPQIRFFDSNNKLGKKYYSQNSARSKQLILNKVPFSMGRNTKHIYSDTDFMLLGMLIERITGKGLDQYSEYDIYQPLGLKDTLFNPLIKGKVKSEIAATEIHGTTRGGRVEFDNVRRYVLQGEVHDEKAYHSFEGVAGHAGLFSTTSDIGILIQTLLNRGGYAGTKIFNESVIDQFIKPADTNGSYGLGWRRNNNGALKWHFGPYASPSAYGHTGWTGTVTVIDPEHDLGIVLLTNARHSLIENDEENEENYYFKGKTFETGKYGSIISLVYEAVLEGK
ncbi:penicillin binding protein PBP4B [Thalassotalea piscium]|uniref:N-acetylmuramoyl-L-alanine amidase n=1 Tax=Thalassotalea piscium TaxID=1230533 RepID=A0A7X0NFC0_9GAMM|nr:penicillin binding protein PBP4B [Thalassotalea piscium]MBB6542426.1 N-acetylmuramoyl-L-alanine amidase [Thalassotalea piscium]